MKATELRVNNWYNSTKFQIPIICEFADFAELDARADGAKVDEDLVDEMFQPILLTEEWLLKFGFETRLINNCFLEYYLSCTPPKYKKDYVLRWWDANNERRIFWSPVLSGTIHHFPCKYVHQLQNLYFALTGNELEIK